MSSSDPRIGGGTSKGDTGLDTNSGILSMLTKEASGWVKTDLVVGLPRSEENHSVNGMQFNPENGHILLTVGGNTNAGAPSQEFGLTPEYAYSSSIVDIDVAAIMAMPNQTYRGQTYKYALPTVNDPTRGSSNDTVAAGQPEVFGGNNGLNQARLTADSPVQIYASGFRNLYDIAVNDNGQIYGIDNGGNPTWGGSPMYRQPDGSLGTKPTRDVTNAINDGGGSINKAPLHRIEEGYYGGHATPIRANPEGAGLYDKLGNPVSLPADWPPVPSSMTNAVEGYYLPPGASRADLLPDDLETPLTLRGEMASFSGSVNGIDDYRAAAFNGEMAGDLVAASLNDDTIYRINLSADGTTVLGVEKLTPDGVLGNGSALDVHAAPVNGPFAGTLWVASYGGGITVLVPDEEPTGPDPVNTDTDNDGLNNNVDPFPVDPTNGQGVVLQGGASLTWSFSQNEPHPGPGGIGNLGFTGVMTNGVKPYTEQYDPNRTIMGGAAAGVLMQNIAGGSPQANNQTDAYQFGIDIGADVATYTITGKVNNPFDSTTPTSNQSVGFFIGTGDQANYIRIVAGAATVDGVANTPVIEMLVETGDAVVAREIKTVPVFGSGQKAITPSDAIVLNLLVDPVAGTVTPSWSVSRGSTVNSPGDVFTGTGTAVPVTGALLAAIQGNHTMPTPAGWSLATGLAVGIIGTSQGADPFSATWNSINITSEAKPSLQAHAAELIVTPNAQLNVSTYNANTIRLNNLAESGSDLTKVVINLEKAILPDGVFFDPNAAGGNAGKGFQINSQVGSFTGSATYQNGSATTGYRQVTLTFNGFNPGESLGFSIDIDPDSMLGFGQSVTAGDVSGAELAGSQVTFYFADGSVAYGELFGSGIAQAEARGVTTLRSAPVVSLQGATSGNVVFPASDPSISVQGTPGATVRVEMMTVAQINVSSDDPFMGNSATNVVYETIVLDQGGRGTVSASLTPERVLVVAAAEIGENDRAISAVSQDLRIIPQGSVPPASIVGTSGADTLDGTSGDDSIDGKAGNDTLRGLAGDDFLNGGAGDDRTEGGTGNDVHTVDSTGDVVVEAAGAGTDTVRTTLATYTLGANVENLVYIGSGKFTGTGNALANELTGSVGADRLDGLEGADLMRAGLGNDTYVVDNAGDVVVEIAGQGSDRILSRVNYALPDNVETLQLLTTKALNGTGNSQVNTLIGNSGVNELDGGGGADVLTGDSGNDVFVFRRGEANGDAVTDFAGAGAAGGDVLRFIGYGLDATIARLGTSDSYVIQAGAAYDHAIETIQIVGVTSLAAGDYTFVAPAGAAPTDITISASSVLENASVGKVVGVLSSVDPDADDTAVFSLLNDAGGRFRISGNDLVVAGALDREAAASHDLLVRVRDSSGNTFSKTLTINVGDVNDSAPVFTSASSVSIDENERQALALAATDADTTGGPITFSIVPAFGDASLFTIDAGILKFITAPDYEGSHGPNYTVRVAASDGVNSSTQTIAVTVQDVNEGSNAAPTDITLSSATVAEDAAPNAVVGTLGSVDPDAGDPGVFTLTDNAGGRFGISGNALVVAGGLDFETAATHTISVQVTDAAGHTLVKSFDIAVSDVKAGDLRLGTPADDVFTYGPALTYDGVDGLGGTDTLEATASLIRISMLDGFVQLDIGQNDTIDFRARVEQVKLTGTTGADTLDASLGDATFTLLGLGGDDVLGGGSGADVLDGGTGNDRMTGNAGDDVFVVDSTSDVVSESAGGGTDTVRTSLSSYTLGANVENLVYTGSSNATLAGNSLSNSLTGGIGRDRLDGGNGADLMTGGAGSDTYVVDNVGDVAVELAGGGSDDRVLSQVSYTLADNIETLQLTTSSSLNATGNALANTLIGNAGVNQLDGRGGSDVMTGGSGNDVFIFRSGEASGDVISDFQGAGATGGDRLSFVGYGAGASLTQVGTSDSYVIHGGTGFEGLAEAIQITGVTNLSPGDWAFA